MGDVGGEDITAGVRFVNVQDRPGQTLVEAHLEFSAASNNGGTFNVTIFGDDRDNAPSFDCGSNKPSDRTTTAASVDWTSGQWVAGFTYSSPNIATVVNAIFNRPSWVNGNALVLLIKDNGSLSIRHARNFESGAPYVRLVLNWQ